jgi:hypothetical protein
MLRELLLPEYRAGEPVNETFLLGIPCGILIFNTRHLGSNPLERPGCITTGVFQDAG